MIHVKRGDAELIIVGSSHISKQSHEDVEAAFRKLKPEIIAVELDAGRLHALLHPESRAKGLSLLRSVGLTGYIFSLIGGWAEKKLGQKVGTAPGDEMLAAVRLARASNAHVALIDQDVRTTLRKLSARLTWKERWNFVVDVFKGLFVPQKIPFDIRKVPTKDIIEKLIVPVKARYPSVYQTLIAERDEHMARELAKLMKREKKIVAVVGAGHEKGILAHLKTML